MRPRFDSVAATTSSRRAHAEAASRRPHATAAAGVPRYLAQGKPAPSAPVTLQRDGDGPLPFQLTPPSLLQPSDPLARFRAGIGQQLQLDPDLRAKMLALTWHELDPAALFDPIAAAAAAAAAANQPAPSGEARVSPTTTPAAPAGPSIALDPDFAKTQRPATGGDVFNGLLKLPQVSGLLGRVRDDVVGRLGRDWSASSGGENAAFVGGSVVVGGSLLAGVLGMKASRGLVLSLLNDTVIPIPKVKGYSMAFHLAGDSVVVGAHLDVGQFLPEMWGFGAGKPKPINDPSWRAVPPQIDRDADGGALQGDVAPAALADGIAQQRGGGHALGAGLRARFEPVLGATLSRVRVHTGAYADALARGAAARAFTTGNDIFFRAGHYAPQTPTGQRLLAHELVHTVQQATGPVHARPAGAALRVSEAGDAHERQAQRVAEHITGGGPAPAQMHHAAAAPAIQREPQPQPKLPASPPDAAARLLAQGPPAWSDYFEQTVPAIAEAAEANDKIGLQRALWLITQAYAEQSPGAGLPSAHRNRLFNEQAAVTFKPGGAVDKVVPGQESEGITLKRLNQNEAAARGSTAMKVSPTFGYDTPERAVQHHLDQMAARWKPASAALTKQGESFAGFAQGLQDSHYAKAENYASDLIALQGQVRGQVVAWLRYTIVQRRRVRLPQLQAWAEQARAVHDALGASLGAALDLLGPLALQWRLLADALLLAERQLAREQAALARLERLAAVLAVSLVP